MALLKYDPILPYIPVFFLSRQVIFMAVWRTVALCIKAVFVVLWHSCSDINHLRFLLLAFLVQQVGHV